MNSLLHWLGATTVAGSIAIALCLAAIPILRRFFGAQAAQGVWIFPLLLLLVSWRLSSPVGVLPPSSEGPVVVVKVELPAAIGTAGYSPTPGRPFIPWLILGWSAGVCACLALTVIRAWTTARLIRSGRDITENPRIRKSLEDLPKVRRLKVKETPDLLSPAICGIWQSVILLPPGWSERAASEELRWVLLHEIGHIRRGDLLWRWAFQFVRTIHWFNPLVWLADRVAREDQEMACDEWVLGHRQAEPAEIYGEVILQVAGRMASPHMVPPAIAAMAESKRGLSRRIRHLAAARPRGAGAFAVTLVGGALILLVFSPATGSSPSPQPPTSKATPLQVEIEAKFLEITSNSAASLPGLDLSDGNTILDQAEYLGLMQNLLGKKGLDLMSAPKVTVADRQQARIQVTREFRYPTEFELSKEKSIPATPKTFASRDVGVTLDVTPIISPDGEIVCSLKPEVVEFLGFIDYGASKPASAAQDKDALEQALVPGETTGQVINQPVFETRRMQTSVALRDGQTALFGGLVKSNKQKISDEIDGKTVEEEKEIKQTLYFMVTARLTKSDGTPSKAKPSPPEELPKLSERPQPLPHGDPKKKPSPPRSPDDIPYGIAVDGKPGYIKSPFAPDSGYVDVRGFPSGTEVKCPYTGKLFQVP